jgi:cytochrome c553
MPGMAATTKIGQLPVRLKLTPGEVMKELAALLVLAGCITLAWGQSSSAKPDLAKGQALATQVCAACHGADGNSPSPANPKLAGQEAIYLYRQLASFKANKDRKNPVMFAMATPLSAEDMHNVAAYFASQKPKDGVARNQQTLPRGQRLYRGGDPSRSLPACAACHGAAGAGVPVQYPRIAGQYAEYTEAQLKAFRAGERTNDANRMMRVVAGKLNDDDIKALSDYIAGLH